MAGENTTSTLNGLFKRTYAKTLKFLVPDGVKLYHEIDFITNEERPGESYNQPVVTGLEHGVTFSAAGAGAFNYQAAVPSRIQNAIVDGSQAVLRTIVDFETLAKATTKGNRAFTRTGEFLIENMWRSVMRYLEAHTFHGQRFLGIVDTIPSEVTLTVTTATWAIGLWAGAGGANGGMKLNIRQSNGTNRVTSAQIIGIDNSTRTLTFIAGTTLQTDSVAQGDYLWHATQYQNDQAGLFKIVTNTGSLFNISAATEDLWKSQSFAVGGNLSFQKVQEAIALGVGYGLEDDVCLIINPKTWAFLQSDEAALVRHVQADTGGPNKAYKVGTERIEMFSQNGAVEVVPSTFDMEGEGALASKREFKRVGAQEASFKIPGKDEYFEALEGSNGVQMLVYSNQGLFCEAPAHQVYLSGITNA